ncbi:cupin-like domain-containing protein [Alteromonas lipotrueiana]|uniref:cupin-like domain-containing protein n=1 Tax=Alteromonas lipotrueiana TaxID=2803815 RepID=UPI001C487F82|nr:cupin-like domain-containing protein [Alteromonas lipotrueiana]
MSQPVVREGCPAANDLLSALRAWDSPRVLPGLVRHWPVVQAANTSNQALVTYLKQFDASKQVDCMHLPFAEDGRMFYNRTMTGFNFSRHRAPFTQVLDELLQRAEQTHPDSLYIGSTSVESCLPGFLQHNSLPLTEAEPLATLWIGNKSRIAAHYDVPDNIICVTAGKRKVTLFAPEQVKNLYIGPLHLTPAGQAISMVDFTAPDLQRFPRFQHALDNAYTVELNPGDALYIPSMWWHHIEGIEAVNMLVNFWWRDVPAFIGRSENTLYHALLTLAQLPAHERKAWQALFDHYVFNPEPDQYHYIEKHARGPLGTLDEATIRQFKAWLVNHLKH